jgi:hypothetical protein
MPLELNSSQMSCATRSLTDSICEVLAMGAGAGVPANLFLLPPIAHSNGCRIGSGDEGTGQASFLAIEEFRSQLYSWISPTVLPGYWCPAKCAGP